MKNLLNLGKVLNRAAQKEVFGGILQESFCYGGEVCETDADCCISGATCVQNVHITVTGDVTHYASSMNCSI